VNPNKFAKRSKSISVSSDDYSIPGIALAHPDHRIFNSFISDLPWFSSLQYDISSALSPMVGFSELPLDFFKTKKSSNGCESSFGLPLDISLIRFIWTEIVNDIFGINKQDNPSLEFSDPVIYDVYTEYVPMNSKICRPKLLHFLSYKSRPAVLDLDLFLRHCSDFVIDYNSIDRNRVLSYIRDLLADANNYEDMDAVLKYESVLKKAEFVFSQFSDDEVLDWLRYLCLAHSPQ
ncbi:unnamed protein product, partial [marine sediment metagenome]